MIHHTSYAAVHEEPPGNDACAATRLAVLRAAAAIGEAML